MSDALCLMIRASFGCLKDIITAVDAKLFEEIPDLVNPFPTERSVPSELNDKLKKIMSVYK